MKLFRSGSNEASVLGVQFNASGIALAYASAQGATPRPSHRASHRDSPRIDQCEFIPHTGSSAPHQSLRDRLDHLGLRGKRGHLVLSRDDYSLFLVEAPPVPEQELRQALAWKVRELIDFPVAEAVVDAFLLPEDKTRSGVRMAYVAVSRRNTITRLVDFASQSGFKLASIDIPELALRNLVLRCCDTQRGAALVKLVPGGGSLQIVRGEELFLARQFALPYQGGLLEDLPADELVLELQRSLDYFERQMRQPPPAQIYLAGENVSADKLSPEIKSALSAEVKMLDLESGLEIDPQIPSHQLSLCLDALGVALRAEQRKEA